MKDFIELYNELGDNKIEELYMFSCLKTSGFNDEMSYNLISQLRELWLDDSACRCISQLSDNLYALYENSDYKESFVDDMATYDILTTDEFEIDF